MPVETQSKVTFAVRGMTCAACQSFVQKTLESQPGVRQATVNLMLHNATVTFDPGQVAPPALVEVVNETGYEAELSPPRRTVAEEQQERELEDQQEYRRLRLRAAVSMALGLAAMATMPFFHHTTPALRWTLCAASLFIMLWAGRRFYTKAWSALRHKTADMNTLIALGTGSAFLYSLFSPGDVYYEAVIFILAFVLTGNALEARAKRNTAAALQALAHLQPPLARVLRFDTEVELPIENLELGGHRHRAARRAHRRRRHRDLRGKQHR